MEFKLDKEGEENRGWGEGGRINELKVMLSWKNCSKDCWSKAPRIMLLGR